MLRQELSSASGQILLPSPEIDFFRLQAHESANLIIKYQLPNGLIPASIGMHDDEHFNGMVWIKDHIRASKWVLDPLVQSALPELIGKNLVLRKSGEELYLDAMLAILSIQLQESQWKRFDTRPLGPEDEYLHLDDQNAPAIKYDHQGRIFLEWGHNQPDNWGTLLQYVGKGIEQGLPILDANNTSWTPGVVIDRITKYVANLNTQRLICRSIWEHDKAWSSYSTRRIVLAGLEQIGTVWGEIKTDSKKHGYNLETSFGEIQQAAGKLSDTVVEFFPADYTDSHGHSHPGDLASLVVVNDINRLPTTEVEKILETTKGLERIFGFHRYIGDPWKKDNTEAVWTMGIPIIARHHFLQAMKLFNQQFIEEGIDKFQAGVNYMHKLASVKAATAMYTNGSAFIPELFVVGEEDGRVTYQPNNNQLAWTQGYIIEASGAGIAAANLLIQALKHHPE